MEIEKEIAGTYVNKGSSGHESQGLKDWAKQFVMTVAVTSVVIPTLIIYMENADGYEIIQMIPGRTVGRHVQDFVQLMAGRSPLDMAILGMDDVSIRYKYM